MMNKGDLVMQNPEAYLKPVTLDSITTKEFNKVMEVGLLQAKANQHALLLM